MGTLSEARALARGHVDARVRRCAREKAHERRADGRLIAEFERQRVDAPVDRRAHIEPRARQREPLHRRFGCCECGFGLLDVLDARAVEELVEIRACAVRLRRRGAECGLRVVEFRLRDEPALADLGDAIALAARIVLRRYGAGERGARGVDRFDA